MAGTISLGGLATGLDTESLISKLAAASSGNLSKLQTRSAQLKAGAATLSDIGKALASLKTAASALSTLQDAGSFAATSSDASVGASADGTAQPGAYSLTV